jgi:hypothetical protein
MNPVKQTDSPVLRQGRRRAGFFISLALLAGLAAALAAACAEPVPLYGTWADNTGDRLSFFDDGTFSSLIAGENFSGTYTILQNVLSLSGSEDNRRVVTEWDIRGNMLYLSWPTDSGTVALTLYKISN